MSNREELTRQAEKNLRQGRVEDAIALYQELADLTPIDWGIVKQLADLFERAGQREAASRQFCRWADHLFVEGFHSKAAALYKKVLKLDASHEHALWQLGEVSLELKLRADARVAFQRVLDLRQRRGDQAGTAAARERLATMDAAAPTPRSPFSGLTPIAPATDVAGPAAPDGPVASVGTPPNAAPEVPTQASAVLSPEPAPAPPELPEARLARLRTEAEEAERLRASDAEERWRAVLDADPHDVATRLRLVQRAMDRRDLEAADRLAMPLDASDTAALVLLVELAWHRSQPDAVRRLIAGRVHAGAAPAHVLAPVDALWERLPAAARAALAAAVIAWNAAGQPGHAVAALEGADRRGRLDVESYLQWVEICVDAGVAGLSRAQAALARAYVSEGRVAEARAVAEDVFVREAGAEPYRALLLDVLDRLGEPNPHRVLVDLLTPPSEVIEEAAPLVEVSPAIREIVELDLDFDLGLDLDDGDRPVAVEEPSGILADALVDPRDLDARPEADVVLPTPVIPEEPAALVDVPLEDAAAMITAVPRPEAEARASEVVEARATAFDWAFLLGRDVEEALDAPGSSAAPPEPDEEPSPEPYAHADDVLQSAVPAALAVASPAVTAFTPSAAPEVDEQPVAAGAGVPVVLADLSPTADATPTLDELLDTGLEPVPEASTDTAKPETPSQPHAVEAHVGRESEQPSESMPVGAEVPSLGAPDHDPYEVRAAVDPVLAKIAAAQPQMAEPVEVLPPTFSIPTSWFSDESPTGDSRPRQRHPEDAYLFEEDDQIPSRWAPRPSVPATPAPPVIVPPTTAVELPPDAIVMTPDVAPVVERDPAVVVAGGADATDAEVPAPEPDQVEEEIDLTQLLEELKQFDTVLPDPPVRGPGAGDEADPVATAEAAAIATDDAPPLPKLSLADLLTPPPPPVEEAIPAPPDLVPLADDASTELAAVFADLQRHTDDRVVAEQQLAAGRVFLAAGLVAEAARAFERASQAPRSRFAAAQALAELHRSRGQLVDAVSWYEQAAAAPVPDAAVKRPVLYDLAESLEAIGETDRALGVLLDLLSQVEDYRDARARLDRLLRVDAGG